MANSRAEEDREILRNFYKMMTPQEGFEKEKFQYCWEYIGANGIYLWQAKQLGWVVVKGADVENPSMRDANGNCVMGDVVLMRMPLDRYEQIQRARQALVREQLGERSQDEVRREIDDKVSRMVGHQINVSFKFNDRRDPEFASRKGD